MTIDEKTMSTYRQSLILALRLKDVPGDRIGEVVAEVESHVADTGEDPTEAFGTPREYAAGLVDEHRPDPWWQTAVTIACAAVAGWFVGQGALALLLGEAYLGRSGWLWLGLGLVVGIPAGVRVHRRSSRVLDPRDGADLAPGSRWGVAVLVGLPIAVVLVGWLLVLALGR
ncbi:MAG: hypothetical protein Q7T56_05665 [Nocardioidaceae bacterium]|nr:hypothetical protein [Nocardioidaceae bacterium]